MKKTNTRAAITSKNKAGHGKNRGNSLLGGRFRFLKIGGLAAAGLMILAGAGFFYFVNIAPLQKVVLTVDNRTTRMDYLLKRTKMSNSTPEVMLQQVAYEQVAEQVLAPQYKISVNSSDIDAQLKSDAAAAAAAGATTETDFKKWYAAQLKATALSDAQFREMTKARVIAQRLLDYIGTTIPATAQQVHVYVIVTANASDAQKVEARLAAGESFASVANSTSVDEQTKGNGGEIGWVPRGVTGYDDAFFNLDPGKVSDPVALDAKNPDTTPYAVFKVTERDANRQVDPTSLQTLKSRALYDLMQQQVSAHVKFTFSKAEQDWAAKQLAAK